MMQTKKLILIAALLITTLACTKKKEDEASTTADAVPTDGSSSVSQLAGSGVFCTTDTTLGGTYAVTHYLSIASAGTYNYSAYYSDATSCSTSSASGGNNYATYSQSGTFAVGGTNTTPATSTTKVTFTMTSASMTVRATSNSNAQNLATWMNGSCTPSPAFSTNSDGAKTLNGNVCTSSGGYAAVTLPSVGTVYQNVLNVSGSTMNAGQSTGQIIWTPGGTSYPTSYTENYLLWQ